MSFPGEVGEKIVLMSYQWASSWESGQGNGRGRYSRMAGAAVRPCCPGRSGLVVLAGPQVCGRVGHVLWVWQKDRSCCPGDQPASPLASWASCHLIYFPGVGAFETV